VFIRHIFVADPMVAMAILVCMGAIIALFQLNRTRPHSRSDQFLIAFIAFLTLYEAMRILKNAGVVDLQMSNVLQDAIELLVAMACLIAALMLRISRKNHLDAASAMRLAQAAPPRGARVETSPKDASSLEILNWAVPRLSDGAFKLLAVLCMSSDSSSGRVPMGAAEVRIKLGKSKEDLENYLRELQGSGVLQLHRSGTTMDLEIVNPLQKLVPATAEALKNPTALVSRPAITESRI
jgi:hypothetical protein